jgi:peroxiredoxin
VFRIRWKVPCRTEIPGFVDLRNRYKEKGLEIIGISLDQGGPGVVKDFIEEFGINYPIVMGDNQIMRAYGGIRGIPTTFLVNSQGRIVKRYTGAYPVESFERDILLLLEQKETP